MNSAIIIPARYASSRLPGKPLLRETGKYLIEHVYERAGQSRLAQAVIVATDDERIASAVRSFGGTVAWTRSDHRTGTDRVAEVANNLESDVVVNLQGDEPMVDPDSLDLLIGMMGRTDTDMATLAVPLTSAEQWRDPNCVKVVCGEGGRALYFSRSPIPFMRDAEPTFSPPTANFMQHLGIYAYRRDFLLELTAQPPSPLEELEKLEQLRVLWMGRTIQVGVVKHAAVGVDTRADYERFVKAYREAQASAAA
jgi:3-deoxy-manno-octulosonate cytidylyltransferase (CMP-KDO synthetase)